MGQEAGSGFGDSRTSPCSCFHNRHIQAHAWFLIATDRFGLTALATAVALLAANPFLLPGCIACPCQDTERKRCLLRLRSLLPLHKWQNHRSHRLVRLLQAQMTLPNPQPTTAPKIILPKLQNANHLNSEAVTSPADNKLHLQFSMATRPTKSANSPSSNEELKIRPHPSPITAASNQPRNSQTFVPRMKLKFPTSHPLRTPAYPLRLLNRHHKSMTPTPNALRVVEIGTETEIEAEATLYRRKT